MPLIVAVLALRFDHAERPRAAAWSACSSASRGSSRWSASTSPATPDELLGAGAILLAALGYAAGPMVLKRSLGDLDPRAPMGGRARDRRRRPDPGRARRSARREMPSGRGADAIVVLGVLCTAVAFVLFGALIAEVGPSRATVITYVAPIVAVALGVAVLGERPGAGAIAGLLLILAGSWLSTGGRLPPGLAAVVTRGRRAGSGERPAYRT